MIVCVQVHVSFGLRKAAVHRVHPPCKGDSQRQRRLRIRIGPRVVPSDGIESAAHLRSWASFAWATRPSSMRRCELAACGADSARPSVCLSVCLSVCCCCCCCCCVETKSEMGPSWATGTGTGTGAGTHAASLAHSAPSQSRPSDAHGTWAWSGRVKSRRCGQLEPHVVKLPAARTSSNRVWVRCPREPHTRRDH